MTLLSIREFPYRPNEWARFLLPVLAALLAEVLAANVSAAPVNDARNSPTRMDGLAAVISVDLTDATLEVGESQLLAFPVEPRRSVWYAWTAPANGAVRLSIEDSPNPSAYAIALSAVDSHPQVALDAAHGLNVGTIDVHAGDPLLLVVGDQWGPDADVTFRLRFHPVPANDTWRKAQPLPTDETAVVGTVMGATSDDVERRFTWAPLVWYTWMAPADGRATVELRSQVLESESTDPPMVYRGLAGFPTGDLTTGTDIVVRAGDQLVILAGHVSTVYSLRVLFDTARMDITPASAFERGTPAMVRVSATSRDGDVREVEFLVNDQTIASDDTPPYEWNPGSMPEGNYSVAARVIRRDGQSRNVPPAELAIRPVNDRFAAATALEGEVAQGEARLDAATTEPGEPGHVGNPALRTVWWRWTAPRDGGLQVTVKQADHPWSGAVIAVYSGDALDALKVEGGSEYDSLTVLVHAGTTYWIAVGGDRGGVDSDPRHLSLQMLPESPNDRFADALALSGNPISISAFAGGATSEPGEWVVPPWQDQSLWWSWTAPSAGFLSVSSEGDTVVDVYSGDRLASLQPLSTLRGGETTLDATGGVRWFVRARPELFASLVRFTLAFRPRPANDAFTNAQPVGPLPARERGELQYATVETGEPDPGNNRYLQSVWYQWTAERSGPVFVGKTSSMDDAGNPSPQFSGFEVEVFLGNTVNDLVLVAVSGQTFTATRGSRFWIRVIAQPWSSRPETFEFSLLPPPANDAMTDAILLAPDGERVAGYTALSTATDDPPTQVISAGGSVWYRWAPNDAGFGTLTLQGSPQLQCAVFSGTDPAKATEVPVTGIPADPGSRLLHFKVERGVPVWIAVMVDPVNLSLLDGGRFSLSVAPTDVELRSNALLLEEGETLSLEAHSLLAPNLTLQLTGTPIPTNSPPLGTVPFRYTFESLPAGRYVAVARGTNAGGLPITSAPQSLRVAPTNDTFAGAALIPSLPVRLVGSLEGADTESGEPMLPTQFAPWTRWWTWQAPVSGTVKLTGSGVFGLFQGESITQLTPLLSHPTDTADTAVVTAGTRYDLLVTPGVRVPPGGSAEPDPRFDFTLAWIPANDRFADRTPVSGSELDLLAEHAAAATEFGDLDGDPNIHARSVWYSWTSPGDGWLTLEESTGDWDRSATVFSGDVPERLRRLASTVNGLQPVILPVALGARYEILLEERSYDVRPPALWKLRWYPTVSNDDFAQRTVVAGEAAELTGITLGATREPGEAERRTYSGNRVIGKTLWYSWIAPETGWARLEQDPGEGIVYVEPFEGDTLESLRSLWPNGWDFNPAQAVDFPVERGHTYTVWVGTEEDEARPFHIRLLGPARPFNDDFVDTVTLTGTSPVLVGSTRNATAEPGEPDRDLSGYPSTVWYRWTSPGRGVLLAGESGWWQLSAWKGNSVGKLEAADYGGWYLGLRTEPGETYQLRVAGNQFFPFRIPLTFQVSPPNDDFAGATPVVVAGDTVIEGTVEACTAEAGENERGVWWRWTAPSSGLLSLTRLSEHQFEVFRGINVVETARPTSRYVDWYRNDYVVTAGFDYFIRAALTAVGPARFRLQFLPDSTPSLGTPVAGAGGWVMPVQGESGQTVEVEQSTDLLHWTSFTRHWLLFPEEHVVLPASEEPMIFFRVGRTGPANP